MKNVEQIITIDGPAAAGKSTIAKTVAKKLGFIYLDTGGLYRAMAVAVLDAKIDQNDNDSLRNLIKSSNIEIKFIDNENLIFLNEINITKRLRTSEISSLASVLSASSIIRESLFNIQKKFAENGLIIAEGRDMGTVVFPNAVLKIFLTAKPEMRAKRRMKDLKLDLNDLEEYNKLLEEIIKRDERDQNRAIAPLKMAKDALILDSTVFTVEEITNYIINEYEAKIK